MGIDTPYPGPGEYMACAIVKKCRTRELMAFKKLRQQLGDRYFKDRLAEAINILAASTNIRNPAGWLYWFLSEEAKAYGK